MNQEAKKRIVLERTYDASLEDVWDLWTTKEGIESWWGPEGFSVEVRTLDLRPGGWLTYAMTATAAPQVEFMKRAGMPLTTEAKVRYSEIVPRKRLAYFHVADFIPGVAPYDVETTVDLRAEGDTVRMTLTFDAMHDDVWTERASAGWSSELGKLAAILAKRKK